MFVGLVGRIKLDVTVFCRCIGAGGYLQYVTPKVFTGGIDTHKNGQIRNI